MATVMVSIDGKTLRFACESGDEAWILELAQKFDSYIGELKSAYGDIGAYKLAIMAGLKALGEVSDSERRLEQAKRGRQDEIDALNRRLTRAEDANQELIAAHKLALRAAEENEAAMAQRVDNIAQRIIAAAGKIAPKSESSKGE